MSKQHSLQNLQETAATEHSPMSDVAFGFSEADMIADARNKLGDMVKDEMRRPGDAGNALERLIERHKLRSSQVHSLLYREPTDILGSVYFSICRAYEAELARQEAIFARRRAQHAKAKTRLGEALLRVADRLDRREDGALNVEEPARD